MAAAAYRVEEEHLWKCPKHPSKRPPHGICAACLRDRLITLCPNWGEVRPCPCDAVLSSSSSTSSSGGDGDPSFGRSRSLAVPFSSRSNYNRVRTASIISVFRRSKTNKGGGDATNEGGEENHESNDRIEEYSEMILRSRSVGVGKMARMALGFRRDDARSSSSSKGKFWNLKAFRSSKHSQGR